MNKRLQKIALCFLLISSIANAQSRITTSLNENWDFAFGYEVKKELWSRVEIPHTWNTDDAPSGQLDYYRGEGIYRKTINIPNDWKDQRIFLQFEGVNTVSNVFINGKHIGEHRGGYTGFNYEITDNVNYGADNEIMVRVSNALFLDVMPLLGDFNIYGGIYRNVSLLRTSKTCISPLDFASSGIYLAQKNITEHEAEVEAEILLNSIESGEFNLKFSVFEGAKVIFSEEKNLRFNESENQSIFIPFTISKPHLWNGLKDPFCYQVLVEIKKEGQVIDHVEQTLGLRYFSVDANDGFFLNGEHLKLQGICRHQDYSERGNALLPKHHDEDLDLILEMGANAIRLSHYPHAPYFYDLLDQTGMITWSEIPFVGPGGYRNKGYVDQPSFRENGKLQLTEMIKQNYNRPSILFWGLFNELKETGDNPYEYLLELQALTQELDPTRLTTAASNIDGDINNVSGLIAWNRYYGWYGGEPSEMGNWADKVHNQHPEYRIGISEYGAGASVHHHQSKLEKTSPSSYWHPEEWQSFYHEENWKAINARPFIWGSFIWNMFDFGAAHRTEGERDGRNDKGLVTFDRKTKKDAFWFYKANWNKDEATLYITNRRYTIRQEQETDIKVYASFSEVELFINGISQGTKSGQQAVFIWQDCNLNSGKNTIEVKAGKGKNKMKDHCIWTVE